MKKWLGFFSILGLTLLVAGVTQWARANEQKCRLNFTINIVNLSNNAYTFNGKNLNNGSYLASQELPIAPMKTAIYKICNGSSDANIDGTLEFLDPSNKPVNIVINSSPLLCAANSSAFNTINCSYTNDGYIGFYSINP